MSLLLALTGATPPSNNQELALTLEGIGFAVVQGKQQAQALGLTLDDIGVSIAQAVPSENGGDTHDGYFHQLWRDEAKKLVKVEKIEEAVTELVETERRIEVVQAKQVEPIKVIDRSAEFADRAQLLESLLFKAAQLREYIQDEEDAEMLLLL